MPRSYPYRTTLTRRYRRSRGYLWLLYGLGLTVACSDITHTVGTVDMESQLREGGRPANGASAEGTGYERWQHADAAHQRRRRERR